MLLTIVLGKKIWNWQKLVLAVPMMMMMMMITQNTLESVKKIAIDALLN